MSWFNRMFLTMEEAKDHRALPATQFSTGDTVLVLLDNELDNPDWENGVKVPGVVVGVNFTAGTVSYDIAFRVENTEVFVTQRGLRANMFCPDDGRESTFVGKEDAEAAARRMNNKPVIALVPPRE